ncbi:MAG: GAF domain-containing protein, partial [Anaerolineaceae bacterium]|nr:GAF domain-containing protein [Anaerolineaceae bacterium]
IQEEALRLTRLVSAEFNRQEEGTRQLLTGLAQVEAVRGSDAHACSAFLAGVLKQFRQYSNLGVANANGDILCSALPMTSPVNVMDRPWFQRTMATHTFAHGDFQIGRITHQPQINFGYPTTLPSGLIKSVVYAAVDLNWLTQLVIDVKLPAGSTFTLYDPEGVILARYPDPDQYIGKGTAETDLFRKMQANVEGTTQGVGLDGVPRLVGYIHLMNDATVKGILVSISIPTSVAYAEADRALAADLTVFGIITLLVLAAAWVGAYFFLLRRISELVLATRRMAGGDFSVRASSPYGMSDLGELSRSFNEMGTALEKKNLEARKANEELRQSAEHYRNLVELSPDAIYIHCEGKLVYVNPACLKLFGANTPDELIGTDVMERVSPEDREIVRQRVQTVQVEKVSVQPIYETYLRLDGSTVDAEVTASPFTYEGKPACQVVARDIAERRKAEQAQARLLNDMTALHAVAMAGNEATSLDELIERVTRLIGDMIYSDDFGLAFLDETTGVFRFHDSYRIRAGMVQPALQPGEGIIGWVAQHKKSRLVTDTCEESDYVAADPLTRSEISVPIMVGERVLGVLNAESTQVGKFTEADERLLSVVAGEVGIAIEKLRLFEAELQRSHELAVLEKVTSALRVAQSSTEMLPIILDQVRDLLQADGTALILQTGAEENLLVEVAQGEWERLSGTSISLGQTACGKMVAGGQPYLNNHVLDDPELQSVPFKQGVQALLCVPLLTQDQLIGVLCMGRQSVIRNEDTRLLTAIGEIAASAIHRARLHEQTEERLQRLSTLRTIDMAITASIDAKLTLSILVDETISTLKIDAADIWLFNPTSRILEWGAGRGFRNPALTQMRLSISGFGNAGHRTALINAVLERRTYTVTDLRVLDDDRSRLLAQEGFLTSVSLPFVAKGQVKGVMEVFHRSPLRLDREWMDFLESLAGQAAIALDNVEMFNNLERSNFELSQAYDATIEGWSRALDLRDRDTEYHTLRVTEMTLELARQMGINESQIVHIRRGALLHDIGKMAIPDEILQKPGPLTPEEWVIMRKHPEHAYSLLSPIGFLRPALDIPNYHHEKWDGSGYPHGLKRDEIPLTARIFALVDVWDALSSDRPYRKAWPEEKVCAFLLEQSGKHFDPKVVEAFFRLKQWEFC